MCLAIIPFSRVRICKISAAAISMSDAVPCDPPEGWWIMIRELGRALRLPVSPAVSRTAPIEAAIPTQKVETGARRCCIVS